MAGADVQVSAQGGGQPGAGPTLPPRFGQPTSGELTQGPVQEVRAPVAPAAPATPDDPASAAAFAALSSTVRALQPWQEPQVQQRQQPVHAGRSRGADSRHALLVRRGTQAAP